MKVKFISWLDDSILQSMLSHLKIAVPLNLLNLFCCYHLHFSCCTYDVKNIMLIIFLTVLICYHNVLSLKKWNVHEDLINLHMFVLCNIHLYDHPKYLDLIRIRNASYHVKLNLNVILSLFI